LRGKGFPACGLSSSVGEKVAYFKEREASAKGASGRELMGRYSIAVKDFRVIKQASVEPEGITLVYGENGMGKSSLGKALVALLSNQHSGENFRHGQSSYAIGVQIGGNRLVYTRNGDVASLRFNDEPERQKFGRVPMSQVEPRFPLKRFDYEDSSFFPNFSFQNEVPLFGDISIYSLFSSMFSSIARVSERVTACQTECRSLAKKRDGSLAGSEVLKEKVSESSKALAELNALYPDIESAYRDGKALVEKKRGIDDFMLEYVSLSASCGDREKWNMAALYDEAQSLFPAVMLVERVGRVLNRLDCLRADLRGVQEELAAFPKIFLTVDCHALVSGVVKLRQLERELGGVEVVPYVPVSLVEGVGRLWFKEHELREVLEEKLPVAPVSLFEGVGMVSRLSGALDAFRAELSLVASEEAVVRDQLQALPCDRFVDGLCPYSNKLSA
jgi:energy-coupling factor transporter ATP-binding protein EcfA2